MHNVQNFLFIIINIMLIAYLENNISGEFHLKKLIRKPDETQTINKQNPYI